MKIQGLKCMSLTINELHSQVNMIYDRRNFSKITLNNLGESQ
jgi:hypothetical protein